MKPVASCTNSSTIWLNGVLKYLSVSMKLIGNGRDCFAEDWKMTSFLTFTSHSDSLNKCKLPSIPKGFVNCMCKGYLLKYNIHIFFSGL